MAVYRFRLCFEEDEEVVRIMDVRSSQTLEDFHFAILKAIEFDQKHNALFYISDDTWKKHDKYVFLPEAGMEETPLFSTTRLSALINDPHQKLLYVYDLNEQWTLMVELITISMKEDTKSTYPLVVRSENKAPKQYKIQRKVGGDLEEDEFDYLTKNLLGGEIAKEMMGEHLDDGETDGMDEEGDESSDDNGDNGDEDSGDNLFGGDSYDDDDYS